METIKFEANKIQFTTDTLLTNDELIARLRHKAQSEQSLTIEVIELIKDVDKRRLYLKLGFSSLFDFVTKDLGYEPSSAMRRIQAARLIRDLPEVETKIADKSLSLSVVSKAQSFFRQEEKIKGQKLARHEKLDILSNLENKSAREAEKELVKRNPEAARKVETVRELSETLSEVKMVIDDDLKNKLDELKLLLSHQTPDLSYVELIKVLVNKAHKKMVKRISIAATDVDDKTLNVKITTDATAERCQYGGQFAADAKLDYIDAKQSTPKSTKRYVSKSSRRYISQKTRQVVWQKDKGRCQYTNGKNGSVCGSQYKLQLDHIHRFRHGGGNSPENLRLLCAVHNQYRG